MKIFNIIVFFLNNEYLNICFNVVKVIVLCNVVILIGMKNKSVN